MAAGARRPRSSWGPAPRAAACLLLWLALLPAWAQAAPPPPPTDPPAPSRTRFVGVCLDGTTACSPVVAVVATEQGWSLPAQVARELGLARFQFVPGSPTRPSSPLTRRSGTTPS